MTCWFCFDPAVVHAVRPFTRIEIVDPAVAALVHEGYRRSPTFRALVSRIESSNWRVFVQAGSCPSAGTFGCVLNTVGRYRGDLYLRIEITLHGRHPLNVIATLGHELQHALEIIDAPGVVDDAGIREMYGQIGSERTLSGTRTFETAGAERTGVAILHELAEPAAGATAADDTAR